jgi:hypothetical protein
MAGWLIDDLGGTGVRLADHLKALDAEPMDSRHPVVAVGSNASPAQLRRKFTARATRALVPMALADVDGIFPGVSAHVNRAGYVPAAPVERPGAASRLFVLWLDDEQLAVLDETEPNYYRCSLDDFPVSLPSGEPISACQAYVSRHGCLLDSTGKARGLTDQRTLIRDLLGSSPALRRLCGRTPEEFVRAVTDDVIRESARRIFRAENWVVEQPRLVERARRA